MSLTVRSPLALAAGVVVAALFMSVVVADSTHPPAPFAKYVEAASLPAAVAAERAPDFSPLYLAVVRLLLPAFGERGLLWLNALLFALACAAVASTVRALSGRGWGLAAGLASAAYRPFLVYCGVLEPEIAIAACLAVAVWAGVRARREPREGAASGWSVLAAAALGCAALLRPHYLLLLPVWALWIAAPGRRGRVWVVTLAGAGVVVLPVLVTRIASGAGPVIMNPGPALYEGNALQASGAGATQLELVKLVEGVHPGEPDYIHVAYRRLAAAVTGGKPDAERANTFWSSLALAGMRAEPGAAVRRFATKAILALSPAEMHDVAGAELLDRRLRLCDPFGFWVLLVALPLVLRARRAALVELAGPLAIGLLSWGVQVAFYASARQRLPLALALCAALPCLARDAWRRHGGNAVAAALFTGAGLAAAIAWTGAPAIIAHEVNLERELGQPAATFGERLARLLDGRAWRPGEREARERVDEAGRLLEGRQVDRALAMLRPVLAGNLTDLGEVLARAEYYVARALLVRGERAAAQAAARRSVALGADDPSAVALVAALSSTAAPVAPPAPPAGVDPLSWDFVFGREVAAVWGRAAGRRVIAPVLRAFPELERTAAPDAGSR